MLEWREHEHEAVDEAAMGILPTLHVLKNCGLYKYWEMKGMRAQVDLLTWLVNRWDVQELFHYR